MTMKDYRTIVVGTDGSALAAPTVARAAWLAHRDDANLVIVCAYAALSRREDARNTAAIGGDTRVGQVLGRAAADAALAAASEVARAAGAVVSAALLIDGDPSRALVTVAEERSADLIVLGAVHDRSLADRLLGTTAEEVTRRARCDVLVVRPAGGEAEFEVPESDDGPQT
ncbi:MAG: universal stress protein [Actinobacteria bacterium]|uniref:Universal stress protein n=1 Tax=Nostocoides veronense TaxID=330836 RepID=A0ABP4Y935_9MICO|nr:universal stress protein [Actinomycetota bacterium]